MTERDVLSKFLLEAKSYKSYSDIERLVEDQKDLSMVPIQPLYIALLKSSTDQVAEVLPKLSNKQRQAFLDIDLWEKDHVDVNSFEYWIEVYSKVSDSNLIQDFVSSEDFLIYLKSRVNIYTFDVEDPEYPDHDNYFLTDDNLLLIEFFEEYTYKNELKYLLRNLYDRFGVENAYSILFKLVNDSFSVLEEDQYQKKKDRLRELGFVDYFDALEQTRMFVSYKQIDKFIASKSTLTPDLDVYTKNQSLHGSSLTSFDETMEKIYTELAKVRDEKRQYFLKFNFLRLINSTITLNNALRGGSILLTRIGKGTKSFIELGLEKVMQQKSFPSENGEELFELFDFFDLYRIGKSLIFLEKNKIKKALRDTPFEQNDFEYFLGSWWSTFLENADFDIPKVKAFGAALHAKEVNNYQSYLFWKTQVSIFKDSIPFISSFFKMLEKLKTDGKLHDEFYLNYEVSNIDFEAVIISSFVNYALGHFSGNDVNKMGVTISELKDFFKQYFDIKEGEYILKSFENAKVNKLCLDFIEQFGFYEIENFEKYLYGILSEHLSGYEFDTLADEDFKHIGGPIILNSLNEN